MLKKKIKDVSYKVKIEENKKAGTHWESNPGHFWLESLCSATKP